MDDARARPRTVGIDERDQAIERAADVSGSWSVSLAGASAVLVIGALLVGAAAPVAVRLVDHSGERLPAQWVFRSRAVSGRAI